MLISALPPLHMQVVESRRSSTGHAGPSVEDQIDAIGFGKLQIIAILATCVSLERCLLHNHHRLVEPVCQCGVSVIVSVSMR